MRNIYQKLLLLASVFASTSVLAGVNQAVQTVKDNKDVFNLVSNDPTQAFLAQLFGNVGHVLHGTSGQLLGQLFQVFNRGVLVIAGIFFIWTIFVTVTTTAHEGKFMGPKQSKPAFAVIRTVMGFGTLVPLPSGYSIIQVFVMWVILHGVGFANTTWNKALDYFSSGGVAMVPPTLDVSSQIDSAGTALQAQVCMFYYEKQARANVADHSGEFVKSFKPVFTNNSVSFPSRPSKKSSDVGCGQFNWKTGNKIKDGYMRNAMQQLLTDTYPAAHHIIYSNGMSAKRLAVVVEKAVEDGATDWINYTLPVRSKARTDQKQYFEKAKQRGWIYAGMYYYGLTSLQRELSDDSKWQYTPVHPISGINMGGGGSFSHISFPDIKGQFDGKLTPKTKGGELSDLGRHYTTAADYIAKAKEEAKNLDKSNGDLEGAVDSAASSNSTLNFLLSDVIKGVNMANKALMTNEATRADPVLQLQVAGNEMMRTITRVWIGGSIAIFTTSAALSSFSSYLPLGFAFRDMLNFFTPLLMLLLVTLYVQGLTMAYYIPMVPFIVFMFAVMGWFVVVIESMIAAPLVSLGLTHVEGHDMWGRSEEAMWLLLNVFLRPVLMIFGLVGGMILSRIGLTLLNIGFTQLLSEFTKINDCYVSVGRFMIYLGLAIAVVNASYSLIHKVPDRVMRWLRSGGDQMSEYVNAATQATQRMTQEAGQQYARKGSGALDGGRWATHALQNMGSQDMAKMNAAQNKQPPQNNNQN